MDIEVAPTESILDFIYKCLLPIMNIIIFSRIIIKQKACEENCSDCDEFVYSMSGIVIAIAVMYLLWIISKHIRK